MWTNHSGQCLTGTVKDARAQWCYEALRERALAAGVGSMTNNFKPTWYLWEHANVLNFKAAISNLAPYYLDQTALTSSTFNAWFSANTNAVDFPLLSATNFLSGMVGSNFWNSTPWIYLDKNTSNGWDGVRAAITNLQWTAVDPIAGFMQVCYGEATWLVPWSDQKLAAETNYMNASIAVYTNVGAGAAVNSAGLYLGDAQLQNYRQRLLVTNIWAQCGFAVDFYLFPTPAGEPDENGHFTNFWPQVLSGLGGTGSNGWLLASDWWGAADPITNSIPAWCAEPTVSTNEALRGYDATFRSALKWNFNYR